MTRHEIDHTNHDTAIPTGYGRPPVLDRVAAEMDELRTELLTVTSTRPTTDAGWAERSQALALIDARRAGWWRILARAGYRDLGVHPLFAHAALIAADDTRDRARFWRDTAAEYRGRAEDRPTSDMAGALSNWHELGVTA